MPPFTYDRLGNDREALRHSLGNHLIYSIGKDPVTATERDWFNATVEAVRTRLLERWMETMRSYYRTDAKRVYYLSLEFLPGRLLGNSLLNLGCRGECSAALADLGQRLEDLFEVERDAALGNGGLGRLAACFLDSMATLSLPGYGYGIRYEYGMFKQRIEQGAQIEAPDNWLRYGNPWEFPRPEVIYPVRFGGRVVTLTDAQGALRFHWVDAEEVMAMAFDVPVPGYGTDTTNNLRLWAAKASHELDLTKFNEGQYLEAVAEKDQSESLSKVLYPDDHTSKGRELRLRQQYLFVCASLQDIVRRFLAHHTSFDELPDKVAIQLNDTHPSLAIPELMRLLVDVHGLAWDRAWDLTRQIFAYTNHTLMPEALETWPVDLFERVLPRHLQIIYEINARFLATIRHRYPGDVDVLRRMSIVDEDGVRRLRMSHLAFVGSHTVNGVSAIHTDLMKRTIFADFADAAPHQIVNITNGVTPRRWLCQANPLLADLITRHLGPSWVRDLSALRDLTPLADDAGFRAQFRAVKAANKQRVARAVERDLEVVLNPAALFDVQVKRIHEYKRQLLNVLHVIVRYNRIRRQPDADVVTRASIFAGKAAPGYAMAKRIIRLIHAVADVVNHDPLVDGRLKVVFIPDYGVSSAEWIIPACDLSEQISTAGTEASGTGNMKLALNGALTIGTLDGATIEMRAEVGEDNIFVFGLTADEALARRSNGYDPRRISCANDEVREALDMIAGGFFSADAADRFRPVFDALTSGGDAFLVLADLESYLACQDRVDALYRDPEEWTRRAILTVARMGRFSSDRAVTEYASTIWGVRAVNRPH